MLNTRMMQTSAIVEGLHFFEYAKILVFSMRVEHSPSYELAR